MRIKIACSIALVSVIAITPGPAAAVQGDTTLVSQAGAYGPKANGWTMFPSISADGRFVAFQSDATNLPDDTDASTDVFVRDLTNGATTLVSRGTGSGGAKGNAPSTDPSISADGRFVAFQSFATNLPNDADPLADVFVRDLASNTTTLVSRASGATGVKGNGDSRTPSISADGRFVAFDSTSDNLTADTSDPFQDVFVRDRLTDTTVLVSRASGVSGIKGNSDSASPSISADGRYVAFASLASNLAAGDSGFTSDVFVRDLVDATTQLASRATDPGPKGNLDSGFVSISADGTVVTFSSTSTNLHPNDGDTSWDVFARDLPEGTTTLVSRSGGAGGAKGNGDSFAGAVSADGRFASFHTFASNLPDDPDTVVDVFVRDLVAHTTTLTSRSATAGKGNGESSNSAVSADGRFVAFHSFATNLPGDPDGIPDVFVHDVLGPQPPPALEINNVTQKEGKSGTSTFTFTVSLDGTPGRTVTADFATKNGTATVGDNDYEFTNGTLTFLPGETTKTIGVTVNGDNKREPSETFKVKIFNATVEIEDGTGVGTIRNDDR